MRIVVITSTDIARCPHHSFAPAHYRRDRTCRCVETAESLALLAELAAARADLDRAREQVRDIQLLVDDL